MDRQKGWIMEYRDKLNWPIFKIPLVCHFFDWCCLKASRLPREAPVGNLVVPLGVGDFIFGRTKAAEETGLSEQTIRTALVLLIRRGSLKSTKHQTKQFTIITVVNFKAYQCEDDEPNQPSNQAPTRRQPGINQASTTDNNVNKEDKVEKKEKTTANPAGFDAFWEAYPRKKSKADALKAWRAIEDPPVEAILIALNWQAKTEQWVKDSGQFIPYPATYLRRQSWLDEPDPENDELAKLMEPRNPTQEEYEQIICSPEAIAQTKDLIASGILTPVKKNA